MHVRPAVIALAALLVPLIPGAGSAQAQDASAAATPATRPSVAAHRAAQAPRIDGVLDDAVWAEVEPVREFVQRWPVEGAAPTEDSWFKVAYDEDFLYFAFMFHDREPHLIRARNLERGGRNDRDDHAYIGLDTFLDGRNAYLFEMNALGTQDDALIEDQTLGRDAYSWDAVFESETVIHEEGWSMEVAIPFRQLRFPEGEELDFGLFVRRTINRKNERLNWPLVPLSYGPGYSDDLRTVSQYGRLTGLKGIRRGRNVEIKPYFIAGVQETRPGAFGGPGVEPDLTWDAGADIKYALTSSLTLDLTVNTDFAQVEADNAQLNLTRFSLFFPEKREFFLERAGIFEHGAPRRTQTFFSRTLGLQEDILAGARLTGQVGAWSVGLLNLETGERLGQLFGDGSANNTMARVQRSFAGRSFAGAILTNQTRDGASNRAFGVDVRHRFGSSSSVEGWWTDVEDTDPARSDQAGYLGVNLRNQLYGASLSHQVVGRNYRPALGFVRRRDIRETVGTLTWSPILERGPFRQATWHAMGIHVAGEDGRFQSSETLASATFAFPQRDEIRLSATREVDRLEAPFAIRPDAVITPAEYDFLRYGASFRSDQSRPLSANVGVDGGSFYGGDRADWTAGFGYRQSKHLTLGGNLGFTRVQLPVENGEFDATLFGLDILASVSRDLFAKALIQYDSFSRNVNANVRVNWIHTPGSDLFLVYNTSWNRGGAGGDPFDPRGGDFRMNQQVGVLKLTWLFML